MSEVAAHPFVYPSAVNVVLRPARPPEFIGHALDFRTHADELLIDEGTICLWRFRAEWKRISRVEGMASLSKAEAARVARFPKSSNSKRFAVERAALREILSGITAQSPANIELIEDGNGRVSIASHDVSLSLAHAGLWIVVGVSRASIGLATASASYRRGALQEDRAEQRLLRARVRHASLVGANAVSPTSTHASVLSDDAHTSYEFDAGRRWHLVDLPMAGANLLSLAAPFPITRVHAYGWTSSSGYALTC
jgi:hypothetical protein